MDPATKRGVSITRATLADREAVRQVCEACFEDDYILHMGDSFLTTGTVLLARDVDEPVGLVRLTTSVDGSGWLSALRVIPSRRREGVGRALCLSCEEAARDMGSETIRLWTSQRNDPAYSLFRGLSYRRAGVFTRWWGETTGEMKAAKAVKEVGDTWHRVLETKLLRASAGYVPIALHFCLLSEAVLADLATARQLYVDDTGAACVLDSDVWRVFRRELVELTVLGDDIAAQVRAAMAIAPHWSEGIGTFLPAGEPWEGLAVTAGLKKGDWGKRAVLCEKMLI